MLIFQSVCSCVLPSQGEAFWCFPLSALCSFYTFPWGPTLSLGYLQNASLLPPHCYASNYCKRNHRCVKLMENSQQNSFAQSVLQSCVSGPHTYVPCPGEDLQSQSLRQNTQQVLEPSKSTIFHSLLYPFNQSFKIFPSPPQNHQSYNSWACRAVSKPHTSPPHCHQHARRSTPREHMYVQKALLNVIPIPLYCLGERWVGTIWFQFPNSKGKTFHFWNLWDFHLWKHLAELTQMLRYLNVSPPLKTTTTTKIKNDFFRRGRKFFVSKPSCGTNITFGS